MIFFKVIDENYSPDLDELDFLVIIMTCGENKSFTLKETKAFHKLLGVLERLSLIIQLDKV